MDKTVRPLVLVSEEGCHSSDEWCCSGPAATSCVTLADGLLLTVSNTGPKIQEEFYLLINCLKEFS